MGLADFMQQLQEQDSSIIYSEEPEQSIKIIPPETEVQGIKIIPPEEPIVLEQPKKIKLKLNKKVKPNIENTNQSTNQDVQKVVVEEKPTIQQPIQQTVNTSPPKVEQVQKEQPQPKEEKTIIQTKALSPEEEMEKLFIDSGTEIGKKAIWIEYYQKALVSRKQNIATEKMKKGKFLITPDNKILLLPDNYNGNLDPDDMLKTSWVI